MADLIPEEVTEKRNRLEQYILQTEEHIEAVIAQKIGTDWSYKVILEHKPKVPSIYFEGSPVIFEEAKNKLSKR
jgi:hypothetical protein